MTAPPERPRATSKLVAEVRLALSAIANERTDAGRMFLRMAAEKCVDELEERLHAPIAAGTIGESWASYVADVLNPAGAGEVQREETKRAFYAGAAAMFGAMLAAAELEEDPAAARVEALDRELADYIRMFKVREGL